jgi:hypothetical protein
MYSQLNIAELANSKCSVKIAYFVYPIESIPGDDVYCKLNN